MDYSNHQLLEESCDIDMMIGLEKSKLLKGQLGDEKDKLTKEVEQKLLKAKVDHNEQVENTKQRLAREN